MDVPLSAAVITDPAPRGHGALILGVLIAVAVSAGLWAAPLRPASAQISTPGPPTFSTVTAASDAAGEIPRRGAARRLLAPLIGPGMAAGQDEPSVTGVAVTSAPGAGSTYASGETIRVTLTFSEAVDVTGAPRLKIDMDPADWGEKWAAYESGGGTASLTFAHTVVEPNYSSQGIAVLADTLELNEGSIRSASSQTDAGLSHAGLDHDPDHKVDWRRTPPVQARSDTDAGATAVAGAPAISSATSTLTSVKVEWTAPASDGGSTITAYDLRSIASDATDKSDSEWTEQHDIWVTGGDALSYRQTGLTPSTGYDFQVRAVNADGDGAWSATQAATTGTPAISGTATLSYAENSATRVGSFSVTGADEDVDEVTWAISGTDASHFNVTTPNGALRLIDTSSTDLLPKLPDFESPDDDGADNSYSITLTATVGGVAKTQAVTVTVTDVDEDGAVTLSPVRPRVGTALTATLTDPDTVSGTTTWTWERSSGRNSWTAIAGATAAAYTPVAGDSGQYLRVTASYTDGHGSGKSAVATAHHAVIGPLLTGLGVSTTSGGGLTPAFESDVLHYKSACAATDTMTLTPTVAGSERLVAAVTSDTDAGALLAIGGQQIAAGESVDLDVTEHSDVIVRVSDADGGFTDYVVHCVRDFFTTMTVTESQAGAATESLISFTLDGYLAIIDHYGVPRLRRFLGTGPTEGPRFFFRFYQVGTNGEYRYHYTTRPATGAAHFILDEDFRRTATVRSRLPLRSTGVHDFRVLPNGNYLLMSYEPAVNRNLERFNFTAPFTFRNGDERLPNAVEPLEDSGIQILTPGRTAVLSWKSWDNMAYEDCTQHWPKEYAHVNLVQYVDGNVIGSFRGCSKVLAINASTGNVVWRLGRSNLTAEQWAERGMGPAPLTIIGDPEGEFCGQHGAELHPGGRLTLFDNGEHCLKDPWTGETVRTSDLYARAVEYALDLDNGEAVFLHDRSQNGTKTLSGTRGGHVEVLDNGDWLISWGRERRSELAGYGNVEKAITQYDPETGTEKLAFNIPNASDSSVQANIRATALPAYALAPQPAALSATAPASERTSVFHLGATDSPQVLITFNRPVADFAATSPSLSVTGGTVAGVSALVEAGEPANAYLVTLTPAGDSAVSLRLLAGKACADGGICAADGSTLSAVPPAVTIRPPVKVSFEQAAYSVAEGGARTVAVRLSVAHGSSGSVTVGVVLDDANSTASAADLTTSLDQEQTLTFLAGENRKTLTVATASDTLVEGAETVILGFGTLPEGVTAGTTASTTITINDATRATIAFRGPGGEVAEGASGAFTVEITNAVTFAADQTINLTLGGSATTGDDYTLLDSNGSTLSSPYAVTLPAGQSSTSFTIRATDDSDVEPVKETVTVTATLASTGASLGARSVTIPPSDVAGVPEVTISADGDITEAAAASFTLQRTSTTGHPLTSALTASIRVIAPASMLAGSSPSTVTFPAGSASVTLELPTRDDTVVEPEGGVTVFVLGSSTNPPAYLTTPQNAATVAVSDDDFAIFTFTASAPEVPEGSSVTLTVDTGGVTFADRQTIELVLSGSATGGSDYTLSGGSGAPPYTTYTLTLPRGARSARATLRAARDSVSDPHESVRIDASHDGSLIDTKYVVIADVAGPPPVITPPVFVPGAGGAGGGGGGGGPSGPSPSTVDFEWTVKHDLEELDAANRKPAGLWSDGVTLWMTDNPDGAGDAVYAYDLDSGERVEEREFALDERNRAPRGVWSDGVTAWVADSGRDRLFAYDLASGAREIALDRRNGDPRGIWSDGVTMWVLDRRGALFAYNLATGAPLGEYELDPRNGDPRGLWSDGVTIWVSDHGAKILFAYRLPALPAEEPGTVSAAQSRAAPQPLERVRDEEFTNLTTASNNSPRGIWSDGDVMYVVDELDGKVYTYNMPDAIDARLASLALEDIEIGEFDANRTAYDGEASEGVAETTVTAEAMQRRTTVVIEPPDADAVRPGHQVALAGLEAITVTVTSADGSRARVYRVQLGPVPWAHCLKGAVTAGFSFLVYEGGTLEELADCAESRGLAALYVLHEGRYLTYIPGAPEFVNRPLGELFAEGVPALTPLIAAGDGPPSDDPVGGARAPDDWPGCLRGEVGGGFSAVVYEGGSVEELDACAQSRGLTALYVLHEGEWVPYRPGALALENRPFFELFPEGVPAVTPLIVRGEEAASAAASGP